jgi:phosphomannomutase
VAERSDAGEWKTFSGDEVGVLLAHWQWRQHRTATGDTDGGLAEAGVTMLASTVSSSMLGAVAKAEGFRFEETLTGFKWMGRRSAEIRSAAEPRVVPFAYEEAIGYCVGAFRPACTSFCGLCSSSFRFPRYFGKALIVSN